MSELGNDNQRLVVSNIDGGQETFQDLIRDWLKAAPWFLVSLVLHGLAGLIIANIPWQTLLADQNRIIQAQYENEELEPLPEEEIEEEEQDIEELEEIIEDPTVTDEEIFDEEMLDDENPIDFDTSNVNDVIGVGGGAGKNWGKKYKKRGRKSGGQATQRAVEWGLEWLAKHQDPEGYWDCDAFHLLDPPDDRCTGKGAPLNDVGVSGLALLAFLGAGNTPTEGPYKKVVKNGIKYLCDVQDPEDGCLTAKEGLHYMYNHAVACLALTEAYGLSKWAPLKKFAKKALNYIHETKNPGKAWRYNDNAVDPIEQNDVSMTGWMIMCMASAKDFGLPYDENDIIDSLAYIDEMTDTASGRTGYKSPGQFGSRELGDDEIWPAEKVEPMTAVAMLCRVFCGYILDDSETQIPMLEKGAKLLRDKLPKWDPESGCIDYYYWYYGSYAMFQMAGQDWKVWKDAMIKAVVENQREDGSSKGSWDPQVDPWGDNGGRVYTTALCTLCLEVFYRYDSILGSR